MEVNIEPVYIKDLDVNNLRGNVLLELCYSIHRKYPGQIHGAQLINNVWFLYVCSNKTRAALIVSGIQARQTRPNSGGVAEGHPRFDKKGVAIIFYALKIEIFRVFTLSD